ncbi:MAG TPA: ABC transporter substrate-binding protein [Xanthobacteraceae bacterium]|jgi:branched-chain amino acid transport system substrate-binding protein
MIRKTLVTCVASAAALASAAVAQQPATGAAISDDVVKIGVLNDMSSLYSDGTGKGSLTAAQMAVADFGGRVRGKPIEVIGADHLNKPDVGAMIARTWYDTNQVDAIVDVPTSSVALAVQQITKEKDRVLLISGGGSSDLTGSACSPNGIHWTYDTYALSNVAGKAMVARGEDAWYFITADYAFGLALERDAANVVRGSGGKVLGAARAPLNTQDFSSFLLQAQASRAKVVALANAGGDTQNAIKQAYEFGLQRQGQKLLALLLNITDAHSLGKEAAQGMIATEGFYWDMDDASRAFSRRFFEKEGHMPTMIQAGVFSAVMHYLKAIDAAGTDAAKPVIAQMKAVPVNDFFARNGHIREDGRMVHDMYLVEVKSPAESKSEWDLYKVLATVSGDEAYRPLEAGGCPLVRRP